MREKIMDDDLLPTDEFEARFSDKSSLKYKIRHEISRESWVFDTKEDFFNKMIEVNNLDEYGVLHFKRRQSFFGPVHVYSHSVIAPCGAEQLFFMETLAACHKDGLSKKFLVNY